MPEIRSNPVTGDWVIIVSYPVVAPDQITYRVTVTNAPNGIQWDGKADRFGSVTPAETQ